MHEHCTVVSVVFLVGLFVMFIWVYMLRAVTVSYVKGVLGMDVVLGL